ncbi:hypothetical protein [Actinomadura bangladeshensis]|uniref:hypothetical protein n=1 Tax=Actinomadura bangladeshensis TaxID=453573 RepID=UPI0031E3D06E
MRGPRRAPIVAVRGQRARVGRRDVGQFLDGVVIAGSHPSHKILDHGATVSGPPVIIGG